MNQTAWSYCAVSSSPQEATLEDQRRWAESAAVEHGWTITREFSGVSSGAQGTREVLETLMGELRALPKSRRPAVILMIRLDRLGRGTGIEAVGALADLRRLGTSIFTREDGLVRIERASDAILPTIRSIVAALENEVRSDKWKTVHARRRAKGLHVGLVPYGVVLIDGKATPYEPEAAIVREIFARAEQRWGYTRLARWARQNAPPKLTPNGGERPFSWTPSTIKSLLNSKTIRGLIVNEEQWQATKAARQSDFRARAPMRWDWPLQGAVRCTCGKLLVGHCSGDGKYRTRYYVCRHHSLEPGRKSHPSHRADKLEAAFAEVLRSIKVNPELVLPPDEHKPHDSWGAKQRIARRRLEEIERRRQRAWALAEEGAINANQLRLRLAELDEQQRRNATILSAATEALSRTAEHRDTRESLEAVFEGLADLWLEARVELQQELAQALSALPEIVLQADPDLRNRLSVAPGAMRSEADDSITKKFIQSITE
ncbi:MAG TPA: recombinase family protein [Candidatus Cybelea sp.]